MHHLNELPSLPADSRLGASSVREPFVDEAAVHTCIQQHAQWKEQRYFGEDFAGRDDCWLNSDDSLALPVRLEVGAFFTPVDASFIASAPTIHPMQPANEQVIQSGGKRPRTLAMVAAAVVLVATVMTGLWAADAFAPVAPSVPSVPSAPSVLRLLRHILLLTHPRLRM